MQRNYENSHYVLLSVLFEKELQIIQSKLLFQLQTLQNQHIELDMIKSCSYNVLNNTHIHGIHIFKFLVSIYENRSSLSTQEVCEICSIFIMTIQTICRRMSQCSSFLSLYGTI